MFEYAEHNKWAKEKAGVMDQYQDAVETLLESAAARGFEAAPLATLKDVFEMDIAAKQKLTEINGKLYEEQVGIIFQEEEFDLNLAVEYAKLVLATYIQDLLNTLQIEKAEMDEQFKQDASYIRRLEADIEKRSYALIIGRANIESQLVDYKTRELEAQRLGMGKELELIAAKIETVREKLKIIPWLRILIQKERAIIDLERQKAVILQAIILLKQQIAVIKEEMIPLYLDKVNATNQLTTAITEEIYWKELLIELGFDRIAIEDAKVAASISEDSAKAAIETLRLDYVKNSNAVTLARSQFDITLAEYGATIARSINTLEKGLKEAAIDLRIGTALERFTVNIEDDISLQNTKNANMLLEVSSKIDKILALPEVKKYSDHYSHGSSTTHSDTDREIAEAISG